MKKASKAIFDPALDNTRVPASTLPFPVLGVRLQQESCFPISLPPRSHPSPCTALSFHTEGYSVGHIPSNDVSSSSTPPSEIFSSVPPIKSRPIVSEYEQWSPTSGVPDLGNLSEVPISEDMPLLFEQDHHLMHIFSGIHFEDGIFYYHEDPSPQHGITENEPWELFDFITTPRSTQLSLHGLEVDLDNPGSASSTLSSPFHTSLSLCTSPDPPTPIELPMSSYDIDSVGLPSETALSSRTTPRNIARRVVKPSGLGRLSSMLTLLPE